MATKYTQLTEKERYHLELLLQGPQHGYLIPGLLHQPAASIINMDIVSFDYTQFKAMV